VGDFIMAKDMFELFYSMFALFSIFKTPYIYALFINENNMVAVWRMKNTKIKRLKKSREIVM
jgi:hypothetical protein